MAELTDPVAFFYEGLGKSLSGAIACLTAAVLNRNPTTYLIKSFFVASFLVATRLSIGVGIALLIEVVGCVKRKSEAKLRGKHILIIEDYHFMGILLMDLLKHYGHHASHAHSGKQALKEIARNPPDIILLDLSLSDTSGLELARKLRKNEETKSISILAMSALPIDKEKSLEAGCNDFILKPFSTPQLLAQLAMLVRP